MTMCATHCSAYASAPTAYHTGSSKFEFDREIYAHATVKDTLLAAQHEKCAFCESKISHVAFGDVEHFRPKAASQQSSKSALLRPGYFWLAYDWDNLLLACQLCNQRFKKNLFPLRKSGRRARLPGDNLSLERPLFIDPSSEEPAKHLGFHAEYAFAVKGSLRGEKTCEELGLNREPLVEQRRKVLKQLEVLRMAAQHPALVGDPLRTEVESLLADAVNDRAEYAAAARALLS